MLFRSDMLALQIEKIKITIAPNVSYQTDLTAYDVANMCGIPQDEQASPMYKLSTDSHVRIVDGKILIPDVLELLKQAAFYRKQNSYR